VQIKELTARIKAMEIREKELLSYMPTSRGDNGGIAATSPSHGVNNKTPKSSPTINIEVVEKHDDLYDD